MKRVLCVLCLVCVMLCGCGQKEPSALVGRWRCEMDISDYLNETMSLEFTLDEFVVRVELVFRADGTVTKTFDRAFMEQQQDQMAENMWYVMLQMHADDLGLEIEEVEQILTDNGWSAEDLRSTMGLDAITDQLTDTQDRWTLEGNQLYIAAENPRDAQPIQISWKNGSFKMTGGDGIGALMENIIQQERIAELLPLVFEKV